MDLQKTPVIPDAHQQIRLGDVHASTQKWSAAIEYYLRAIEYFKAIQNTLQDTSLIWNIQCQLMQCEKTIHFCRLKNCSEQAMKAECHSKITRAHSVSSMKPPTKINRMMPRQNTVGLDGMDSFAALIFPNNNNQIQRFTKNPQPPPPSVIAKKNIKNDSQKMEELKTSYEATKSHLKTAFDEIERLKQENNQLRFGLSSSNHEIKDDDDEEEQENELEATL